MVNSTIGEESAVEMIIHGLETVHGSDLPRQPERLTKNQPERACRRVLVLKRRRLKETAILAIDLTQIGDL
jgi:hypothetical protein